MRLSPAQSSRCMNISGAWLAPVQQCPVRLIYSNTERKVFSMAPSMCPPLQGRRCRLETATDGMLLRPIHKVPFLMCRYHNGGHSIPLSYC
ncbi:unnamed protein product [Boreogadus saida]